ncbi:TPA: hypothetical protein IAC10_10615 [Candidatus Scatousia excrementigallinarum]|uniref:Uncharacterized protein n=1 Tax=Candidatus Scatousia excrementigallinarum TaxID=2840935 RepID=A0A9D1F019_9BACT|nr:hypothetical protein [Candidatus Scatousia excrementigallinarum]
MTKTELKTFFNSWKKVKEIYRKYCPENRTHFPEPLQKEIIKSFYDTSLKIDNSGSYDFVGNVELKSSTTVNGCNPFSPNQHNCSRILYMEITDHITVYDIAVSDVSIINARALNNDINITLGDYKTNAIKTVEVI